MSFHTGAMVLLGTLALIVEPSFASKDARLHLTYVPALRASEKGAHNRSPARSSCVDAGTEEQILYQPPYGDQVEYRIDQSKSFSADSNPRRILLAPFDARPSRSVMMARGIMRAEELRRLRARRGELRWCTLLVYVDSELVGAVPNGDRFSETVPLGVYQSSEAAREMLDKGSWDVVEESDPDVDEAVVYTRWNRARARWKYACDERVQRRVEQENPDSVEELREWAKDVDCSEGPPEPPESLEGTGLLEGDEGSRYHTDEYD